MRVVLPRLWRVAVLLLVACFGEGGCISAILTTNKCDSCVLCYINARHTVDRVCA